MCSKYCMLWIYECLQSLFVAYLVQTELELFRAQQVSIGNLTRKNRS